MLCFTYIIPCYISTTKKNITFLNPTYFLANYLLLLSSKISPTTSSANLTIKTCKNFRNLFLEPNRNSEWLYATCFSCVCEVVICRGLKQTSSDVQKDDQFQKLLGFCLSLWDLLILCVLLDVSFVTIWQTHYHTWQTDTIHPLVQKLVEPIRGTKRNNMPQLNFHYSIGTYTFNSFH